MELESPDTGVCLPLMDHGRLFVANRLGSLGGQLPLAAIGCLGGRLWLQPRAAASGCCLWSLPLLLPLGRSPSTGLCLPHRRTALRCALGGRVMVRSPSHCTRRTPAQSFCCLCRGVAASGSALAVQCTGLCLRHRRTAMLAPRSACVRVALSKLPLSRTCATRALRLGLGLAGSQSRAPDSPAPSRVADPGC